MGNRSTHQDQSYDDIKASFSTNNDTIVSDTTFDQSSDSVSNLSTNSLDNSYNNNIFDTTLQSEPDKISNTTNAYESVPANLSHANDVSQESAPTLTLSFSQSSGGSFQFSSSPSITPRIKMKNKGIMCHTDGMCNIQNKDFQKIVLSAQFAGFMERLKEAK